MYKRCQREISKACRVRVSASVFVRPVATCITEDPRPIPRCAFIHSLPWGLWLCESGDYVWQSFSDCLFLESRAVFHILPHGFTYFISSWIPGSSRVFFLPEQNCILGFSITSSLHFVILTRRVSFLICVVLFSIHRIWCDSGCLRAEHLKGLETFTSLRKG